jgi:hypothetical protein
VVADPIDGAHRALLFVLLGLAEIGGRFSELQLEQVLAMPNADQLGGELLRFVVRSAALAEPIDGAQKGCEFGIRCNRVFDYHNFVSV